MRLKLPSGTSGILTSGLLFLGWCAAPCGNPCHRCNTCPGAVSSDFFGYYPTNWRPWPTVTVTSNETSSPPAKPAAPMPSAPPKQSLPKSLDRTSFPSTEDHGSKVD
jgi:hypothetical protein